ncbi:MAG: Gfo/Idh/MocA family oxidoreductase [Phycisphaerales bacterium]|nr:MAG: Gfo/Idh/MocA family oxidoreductase [Phycisphaerales bacterium]
MRQYTRRGLVKRSLFAAGTVLLAPQVNARALGANQDIRLAIVGLRKKGKEHINGFREILGVRIVALCDCDTEFLDFEAQQFNRQNVPIKTYTDCRRIIDNKDIDAVVVVTPDHWHALLTIWACQAGKDVYVEKPACHNIWEGRKMVEAARKYERIVQVGSQNRSDVGLREAIPYIHEGHLGKILMVRGFSFGRRSSIGKVPGPQPIPPTCDYNLFQGPASLTPLMRKELHYDWHWFWDTGTGEMGNLGAHQLDHARWAMGHDAPPPSAIALGGRFGYNDDAQTPNTHTVYFDYKPVPLIYEMTALTRAKGDPALPTYRGLRTTLRVECEGGFFAGGRGGGWAYDNNGKKIRQFKGDGGADHQANFIKAVHSRRVSDLRADILQGHISATLCHMANISYRLAYTMPPSSVREAVADNQVLAESADRLLSHVKANDIDLKANPVRVGSRLQFDIPRERFTGEQSEWANMFLKRVYRPPFVVPETV